MLDWSDRVSDFMYPNRTSITRTWQDRSLSVITTTYPWPCQCKAARIQTSYRQAMRIPRHLQLFDGATFPKFYRVKSDLFQARFWVKDRRCARGAPGGRVQRTPGPWRIHVGGGVMRFTGVRNLSPSICSASRSGTSLRTFATGRLKGSLPRRSPPR